MGWTTPATYTVGQVVTAADLNLVRDNIVSVGTPPIFEGYQATVQSIPNATATPINLDAEMIDSASGHSNTTNNSRYTCQVAGWYLIGGTIAWTPLAGTRRITFFYVNGVESATRDGRVEATGTTVAGAASDDLPSKSILIQLAVGDYVQMVGYQTSGAAMNTVVANSRSSLTVQWVSA